MEPLYVLTGTVMPGKKMGRALGFPTANLSYPEGPDLPGDGVYIANVYLDGEGVPQEAILNQGRHPTLPDGPGAVEVHLLHYDGDLYGRRMRVEYLAFLRPEVRFSSVEALNRQLRADREEALAWFGRRL